MTARPFAAAMLSAAVLATAPALAEGNAFDEAAVAAMKGGIVIEAPYAVSFEEGEIVVFMTVHNGSADADVLTGVATEAAETARLAAFEGRGEDRKTTPLDRIEAPGNEAVLLDQDGYHVLLSDLAEPVEDGGIIPLVLQFEETGEMKIEVSVAKLQ